MAFTIFPVEVWEVILGKLEDSTDILCVFRAYPGLEREGILRKTRHLWLFEQVVSHIIPWLHRKDLFILRQVCRKWCRGVDNFLENHPTHRAYSYPPSQERGVSGQVWIPEASPRYINLWECFRGVKNFTKLGLFKDFLKDMDSDMNPFVGRAVYISDYHPVRLDGGGPRDDEFWDGALDFLRRFGGHIWFLEIHYYGIDNPCRFSQLVIDMLRVVPELKGLTLAYHHYCFNVPASDTASGEAEKSPPILPHLETLEMVHRTPESLVNFLVTSYSQQIRRLSILLKNWRRGYVHLFPNLTEFTLLDNSSTDGVTSVFNRLDAPALHKLQLRLTDPGFIVGANLLKWLKPFPRLSEVVIICSDHRSSENFTPSRKQSRLSSSSSSRPYSDTISIPSLKSLKVHGDLRKVDFTFLNSFPSLQLLQVMSSKKQKYFAGRKIYERNIWEVLPKLNGIFICGAEYGDPDFHLLYCTRAKYEWLRKEGLPSTSSL